MSPDIVWLLSKGNPGALEVTIQLVKAGATRDELTQLHQDKIVGPLLWMAYKDFSGQDVKKLLACIREKNPEYLQAIEKFREEIR